MERIIVPLSELKNGDVFQFAQFDSKKKMAGEIKPQWRVTMEGKINSGITLENRLTKPSSKQPSSPAPLMISASTLVTKIESSL